MKTAAVKRLALCGGLLAALVSLDATCWARPQEQEQHPAPADAAFGPASKTPTGTAQPVNLLPVSIAGKAQKDARPFSESRLGLSLIKNIAMDQKAIWTSPAHLRLEDANWLLPFAGVAAASFASDTHLSAALAHSPTHVRESNTFSNYGIAAFGGVTGGLYLWGEIARDGHKRETGILSGEAVVDALGATTALQYTLGRARPGAGSGQGEFFRQGTSFPSDHAAAAWAAATVIAHEYPGPLTKLLAYGLASAVSVSRVTGRDHFPSDVLVGSAIGWLVGQHVYRAHHDPELGGGSWETFREAHAERGARNPENAGSPYVLLNSWIYPALDRLIALGYIHSAFQDVRPLTRLECAALVEEAQDSMADGESARGQADVLAEALRKEFQPEFSILDGAAPEQSVQLESLYAGVTAISGPPLHDSYHFGQTVINDFGRPYEQGFNSYDGFSGYATTGRYVVYVRGEFQHAPSGSAYPLAARQAMAAADNNPVEPAVPVPGVDAFRLLDTYLSANISGWDFSVGKQSLWWGRGVGGALLYSDNAEPIYMFRARPTESVTLPWILRWLGPMKGDFFFGKLSGNQFPARPLIHGLKLTAKPTRYLEASLLATSELGGVGRPLTLGAIYHSFFSTKSSDVYAPSQSPGKRTIGADFSYAFPHLRDKLQFYANGLLPEDNPTSLDMSKSPIYIWQRLAIRTGIYIPRLPHLPKVDFRVESAYTNPPTARSQFGQYIYYNNFYHDLYTNKGNLIGDWVGREGTGFQGWSTLWLTPRHSIQWNYRHAKVASDFVPGGETINDGAVKADWQLRSDLSVSASLQYERWLAPILAPRVQSNVTSSVEIQFTPRRGASR